MRRILNAASQQSAGGRWIEAAWRWPLHHSAPQKTIEFTAANLPQISSNAISNDDGYKYIREYI